MADHMRTRDAQARGEIVEQGDERVDLRIGERAVAVVVELDADRGGIDVADGAPAARTRVPGATLVGDQLVQRAVGADEVVRADRAEAVAGAQRVQALRGGVLLGVVDDDQRRPACIVVG